MAPCAKLSVQMTHYPASISVGIRLGRLGAGYENPNLSRPSGIRLGFPKHFQISFRCGWDRFGFPDRVGFGWEIPSGAQPHTLAVSSAPSRTCFCLFEFGLNPSVPSPGTASGDAEGRTEDGVRRCGGGRRGNKDRRPLPHGEKYERLSVRDRPAHTAHAAQCAEQLWQGEC